MASGPQFASRSMYEALAERVNGDQEWLANAGGLTFTMTHVYTEPVDTSFRIRLEGGKLVEIEQQDRPLPADFVLTAPAAVWEQIVTGQLCPKRAITTKDVAVTGEMLELLKKTVVLKKLVGYLGELDLVFSPVEPSVAA